MKKLEEYIKEGKLKKGAQNPSESESLMIQEKERLKDLLSLEIDEKNCTFRYESAYEVIREAYNQKWQTKDLNHIHMKQLSLLLFIISS